MRLRFARSPWWLQALVYGPVFGLMMTVFAGVHDGRWIPAIIGGAIGGVLFGVVMGIYMSRLNRRMLGELEDVPTDELRAAVRAASRGSVPADPRLRALARGLVQRQRDEMLRTRRRSVVTFAIMLVLDVALAVTSSPWWWPAAVLPIGFLALTWWGLAQSERRLRVLDGGDLVAGPGPR